MSIYVVQSGDTLSSISNNLGVASGQIAFDNQLVPPYALAEGQALFIAGQEDSERNSVFRSGGYIYPFISRWVLSQTLPFLTSISIFSYGFTEDGQLISPPLDDESIIEAALPEQVRPILTLTPLDSSGKFNNQLIHSVVSNSTYKERLFSELMDTVREKNYFGVDIDFEYIIREDRDLFTAFVSELTEQMNNEGYEVSVALAPKTSSEQMGLLYEGKDYQGLGAAADRVLLMTYEWGYKYGPNMAVAPINLVRRVVEYATTQIPRGKINLGIPNYGYDWPLPYVKNQTVARTIGNIEAVQIAVQKGAAIQFDETAMSPFFQYEEDGIRHEVWFEDVRSIQAKLNLIKEYQLEGAGYWQLNQLFRANWLLWEQKLGIQKSFSEY